MSPGTSVRWWSRRLWVHQPVEICSPLSVQDAAARLDAELFRRWSLTPRRAEPRVPAVTGHVRPDRVRLVLARDHTRNSWRPVLRARLEPDGVGSRLVGRIGAVWFARWFTTVWALVAAVITVVAVVLGVGSTLAGTTAVPTVLLVTAACLALDGGFLALTAVALRSGERDEAALRDWLRRTLEAAGQP
jgi:hypothetical protein